MADLTFFGGVGEIGGNQILVQDKNTRIFLDFGRSFGKEKLYYEEPFLTPREEKHLLKVGLLPPIKRTLQGFRRTSCRWNFYFPPSPRPLGIYMLSG